MPRYYFHSVHNGIVRDGEGMQLRDIDHAKRHATLFAGDLLKEVDGGVFTDDLSIDVTNDRGLLLFRIAISGILAPGAG
jgi:hypothetical protein